MIDYMSKREKVHATRVAVRDIDRLIKGMAPDSSQSWVPMIYQVRDYLASLLTPNESHRGHEGAILTKPEHVQPVVAVCRMLENGDCDLATLQAARRALLSYR